MSKLYKSDDTFVDDLLSVLPDNAEQNNILRYLIQKSKDKISVKDIASQSQVDEETGIQALTDLFDKKQVTIDDFGEVNITDTGRNKILLK